MKKIDNTFRESFKDRIKLMPPEETRKAIEDFTDRLRYEGKEHIIIYRFGVLIGAVDDAQPHELESDWLGGEYTEDEKKAIVWSLIVEDIEENEFGGCLQDANKTPYLNDFVIME